MVKGRLVCSEPVNKEVANNSQTVKATNLKFGTRVSSVSPGKIPWIFFLEKVMVMGVKR